MSSTKPNIVFFFWDNLGWGEWLLRRRRAARRRRHRASINSPPKDCGC